MQIWGNVKMNDNKCEYCENSKVMFSAFCSHDEEGESYSQYDDVFIYQDKLVLANKDVYFVYKNDDYESVIKIKYCPFCGKELK